MKNIVRKLLVWLAFATLVAADGTVHAWQTESNADRWLTGTVVRVVDGDTIWLQNDLAARPLKIRIEGMDAPEVCQAGGMASRDFLRQRILGETVRLKLPRSRRHDDYGRTLGRLEHDEKDIGRWMVSNGHAWTYASSRSAGPYAIEQAQAMRARRGLFANGNAENPRSFRLRQGSCYPPR